MKERNDTFGVNTNRLFASFLHEESLDLAENSVAMSPTASK